jgi:RNA polymerase sigma factor (sigma-70 family)
MEKNGLPKPGSKKSRYVVAMMLGTALSALGSTSALAASSPVEARAVKDISRYCTACWRNARLHPDSWSDCTQEVFSRLLERVDPETWDQVLRAEGEERREFFRAIDAVKKRTQRSRKPSSNMVDSVADRHEPQDRQLAEDREAVRQAADQLLTSRQRQILELSFDGWSVHDISGKLHVPAERVSDEKYKAVRKLREHLASAPNGA